MLFLLFFNANSIIAPATTIYNTHKSRKFDAALKSKDPSWGIRDLEAVIEVANAHGLEFVQSVDMPANNLSVLFCKK
jgi:hypothetical protein